MNNKILVRLLSALAVLLVLYFVMNRQSESGSISSNSKIFADINGQVVSKIKIEQEDEVLLLELKDGYWQLPAKNFYRADSGKVRSLLLSIFDMSVGQTIPTTSDRYDKLGLSEEAIKRGNARISLSDSSDKLLVSLRLGDGRKGKNSNNIPLVISGGQFVKRENSPEVYILDKPIVVNKGATSWLDVNLLNVLPSNLFSIMQVQNINNSTTVSFELLRTELSSKSGQVSFDLQGVIPEGKALQQSAVLDISSALEDLTIADVLKAEDKETNDLVFDNESIFKTTSGLIYRVLSAQKGEKSFAKISVKLDPELISELKDSYQKKADAVLASTATSTTSTTIEVSNTTAETTSATTITTTTLVPKLEQKYATQEEAEKINAELSAWVYEIPAYKAKRFRSTKSDLIEAPKPPSKAPSEQAN